MSNLEKNKKKQAHQVRFAMGNFFTQITGSSTFTDLLPDYQEFFEVLMRSEDADDSEFRERAILLMHFCKNFHQNFHGLNWQTVYNEAENLKDEASLKLLPSHEL